MAEDISDQHIPVTRAPTCTSPVRGDHTDGFQHRPIQMDTSVNKTLTALRMSASNSFCTISTSFRNKPIFFFITVMPG